MIAYIYLFWLGFALFSLFYPLRDDETFTHRLIITWSALVISNLWVAADIIINELR